MKNFIRKLVFITIIDFFTILFIKFFGFEVAITGLLSVIFGFMIEE